MNLIDTHTHIFDEAFDGDREQVVARAAGAGVAAMLCPAIDPGSNGRLHALCDRWPDRCFPMMGLHPTSVNDNPDWRVDLETVLDELKAGTHSYVGVGEIGLDLHWSREWIGPQREAFAAQIEAALSLGLPVSLHIRDAWPEALDLLRGYRGRGLHGVLHAFSGTTEDAAEAMEAGDFLLGVGGVVTFRKSLLPELLTGIPLERMVLETDAPYLAPVPMRGKRNEPAFVTYVCEAVARIKGVDTECAAEATSASARRMFGLA